MGNRWAIWKFLEYRIRELWNYSDCTTYPECLDDEAGIFDDGQEHSEQVGESKEDKDQVGDGLVALDGIKPMNYKILYNSTVTGQHGQEEGFVEPTWC